MGRKAQIGPAAPPRTRVHDAESRDGSRATRELRRCC
jgi:hypothetical protein